MYRVVWKGEGELNINHFICLSPSKTKSTCRQGSCQGKNPKIRQKLGGGWVGQASTQIFCVCLFLYVFFVLFFEHVSKKMDWEVGGWRLANPIFSPI